jgi:cell division protein FtsB
MSTKLFTTVLALVTVVPFGYIATQDAVRVTDTLQKQNTQIVELKTASEQLDKKLETTQEVKQQTEQEVQQLDKQTLDTVSERQRLEAELGAN